MPSNGGELRSGKPASLRYRSTHFRTVRGQTSTASPTVFDVCPLATCHTIRSRPCGVAGNAYAPAHPEGGCKKRICTSDESVVRTPRLQRPCFPSHTRSCCAGRWATQLEPRQRASHLHRRPCAATALSRNWPLVQRRGDAAQRCGPRLPMTPDSIGCVMFRIVDPERGFTSSVIRDARRFVGRSELIKSCMNALNAREGLIAVYGRRGVGKSSLLRQIQQMANGNYDIVQRAGLAHLIPSAKRKFYTVYYSCDSRIANTDELLKRLCNDTDVEDGLLRLVPDNGKELTEFSRSNEASGAVDLKLLKWGVRGTDAQKYSSVVPQDLVQSFRNFVSGAVNSNNRIWSKRDGILLLLDEFDVIADKSGMGSLIKSLTSPDVKFGICGIGQDLGALISDHRSVGRLIEQGAVHVTPMSPQETRNIFSTAQALFDGIVSFHPNVIDQVVELSEGYPYFAQLIGKSLVQDANEKGRNYIDERIFSAVLDKIRMGNSFPNLESQYQLAIGQSKERAMLLALLAEQRSEMTLYNDSIGQVVLQRTRATAQGLGIEYIDQLMPRLVEDRYGPVLVKSPEQRGIYEFADPVFRAYVKLRRLQ